MNIIRKILFFLSLRKVDVSDRLIKTFGSFGIITFPLFYLVEKLSFIQNNEFFLLRLSCFLTCIPLFLIDRWPSSVKIYKNIYWYFSIFYCLPFFVTYMFIENYGSGIWFTKVIIGMFWLVLITDWLTFLIILPSGILMGWATHYLINGFTLIDMTIIGKLSINYILAILIGTIFSRSKDNLQQEKLHTMKVLAGSIAHELRTPLSALMMDVQYLAKYFPYYQDAYAKAREAKLPIHTMSREDEADLAAIPKELQTISQNANTMITMLLTNLNEGTTDRRIEACSMKLCVEEALKTYPFSLDEKRIVHWQGKDGEAEALTDFTFLGHKELTKHVLYNLLKNALYAIASAGKGEIFIAIDPVRDNGKKSNSMNKLILKDTGSGISPDILRHIFNRFYTQTEHGTGIGLAFCQSVIQSFGGNIVCSSKQGEHTTFTISLPAVKESSTA